MFVKLWKVRPSDADRNTKETHCEAAIKVIQ